ncbi:hypothetical protein COBT_002169, partial [Conglomerata obtusa]
MLLRNLMKLITSNNHSEAYTLVKKMLEDEKMSKNIELLTLKGYIETRIDNEALAKQTFKNVIKLDPHAYEPWMYLGEIYINEEEFEKAYTSFKLSYKKTIATPYLLKRLLSLAMYFKRFDEIKLF